MEVIGSAMAQQALESTPSQLAAAPFRGLSKRQVTTRRASGLGNDIELDSSRSYRQILRENLFTFFNIVLFGIGLILLLLGSPRDAFFTISVALLNVAIATFQEVRAKQKLDQISLLARPKISVIREGHEEKIDPREIVQGDLLVVESGDQIVADGDIVGDGRMAVDESLLTGEANLVSKQAGDAVLSGSFCVTGRAMFQARKVGHDSFASQLTEGARTFTREYTPLQREVDLIIRILLLVVVFFGTLITLSFFINEETTLLASARAASVIFGLAPSSLFLTIVVAYALGALRIADKGALIQQANSIESLCHVTVLCLDKTGTLTANRIRLKESRPLNDSQFARINIETILGNYSRTLSDSDRTLEALAAEYPGEQRTFQEEVPFASERKWSGLSFNGDEDLQGTFILGAPEALQPHLEPNNDAGALADLAGEWSSQGLRVLLFACRSDCVPLVDDQKNAQVPDDLQAACLLGFSDELRPKAQETLEQFARTGIELKIISGDNAQTVAALARQVGLGQDGHELGLVSGPDLDRMSRKQFAETAQEATIFGRITPAQKEKLIRVLRNNGHYVAMAGDGVNDVLALKQANLSIAMQSGSQASRSVSDIILLNDSFAALPQAFIEGQRILNGMEDIFRLYMSRIFSLTLLIAMIAMLAVGFPFTPSQSSIISLLTLTLPAFALAIWARPGPVYQAPMTRRLVHFVLPAAITMSIAGLIIYLYFSLTTRDASYAQLTLTYAMIGMGLILVIFVEPPTAFWVGGDEYSGDARPTLLAVGLFLLFLIALTLPMVHSFTGLTPLRQPNDYAIIGLVTILWVLALRRTWRTGIIDRYLNLRPKDKSRQP
jgi:cation-transporting ATPase E